MITSHYPNVSINTANPPTEQARRDNSRIDLFTPVKHAEKSAAEKPVLTDEKSRYPSHNQNNTSSAGEKETETYQAINAGSEQNPDKESTEQQQEQQKQAEQKQAQAAEQQKIQQLKARDSEVKAHEQAHASVGGSYAGAPSYSYQQGPDGKRYAVGGEVQIDIAPIANDAKATITKMQQVQAAALAPAQPSSADLSIAAKAAQQAQQARAELIAENATDMATQSKMQQRRDVISGFYQQSTLPQQQNPAQTV